MLRVRTLFLMHKCQSSFTKPDLVGYKPDYRVNLKGFHRG